jgi:predicted acetylornithine/succinylornithine family transaminase
MTEMSQQEILDTTACCVMQTYARYPIALVRGEGCRVWDAAGREYLDFVGGLAVNGLGHAHPTLVRAIREQAGKLIHVSNLYHIGPQAALARLLVAHSFADKVFFCNSGAEANEAAIKLARKVAKDRGKTDCYEIVTMRQSFHGRTLAAMSATGQEKIHRGFEPIVPGFRYVPFNDLAAAKEAVTATTSAVMVEPVQGEGGVHPADPAFLPALRELCDQRGALLILDEVQCGMGRTGKLFAYEHYQTTPDIMTLAKSLAGGVPIGAMLATDRVAESFSPGTHASTFGGNPLACAGGLAVVETLVADGFLQGVQARSRHFEARLRELQARHSSVRELRIRGLMVGLELDVDGAPLVTRCLERGFLINCTMGSVLRFLPPLIVTDAEIDRLVETLDELLP